MQLSPQCETTNAITNLRKLPVAALKENWFKLFKSLPPAEARKDFLARAISYKLQEQAFGALSSSVLRQLRKPGSANSKSLLPRSKLKPGSRLLREWQGTTYEVVVTESGFLYRDVSFRSLSEIACKITGTHWSGPRFFGLSGKRQVVTNYTVDLTSKTKGPSSAEVSNGE